MLSNRIDTIRTSVLDHPHEDSYSTINRNGVLTYLNFEKNKSRKTNETIQDGYCEKIIIYGYLIVYNYFMIYFSFLNKSNQFSIIQYGHDDRCLAAHSRLVRLLCL